MLNKWKLLSSKMVLDNKWHKVRQDTVEIKPGKVIDDYFVNLSPDVVMILALTEDGNVVLVRQYKHGYGDIITELPAGFMDGGEDPLGSAKRELQEETGYTSHDWTKLGYFIKSPGKIVGANMHFYLANSATKTSAQHLDSNEDIEVSEKPFSEVLGMAKRGELQSMDTVLALLLAEEKVK